MIHCDVMVYSEVIMYSDITNTVTVALLLHITYCDKGVRHAYLVLNNEMSVICNTPIYALAVKIFRHPLKVTLTNP